MIKVTRADLRAIGFCGPGSRLWFARHGLNWSLFVQHGIDVAIIEAIPDPMAQRAAQYARQRAEQEQQAWAAAHDKP